MKPIATYLAMALIFCCAATAATEDAHRIPAQWAEGGDSRGGVNIKYFNQAAQLYWEHTGGDWTDATGRAQGEVAFAVTTIPPGTSEQEYLWDITAIARRWLDGSAANNGVFLRVAKGGNNGTASFHSRETEQMINAPALVLEWRSGKVDYIPAAADAHADPSTVKALGKAKAIRAGGGKFALIRFNQMRIQARADAANAPLARALLSLTTVGKQYGTADVGVFLPAASYPPGPASDEPGIASEYPGDSGISTDARVVFAEGFEDRDWLESWNEMQIIPEYELADRATADGFAPLSGRALKVTIPQGKNLGLNLRYLFAEHLGREPEQMYFRYYLRLGRSWHPDVTGGKLPGLAGTYGRAGWGGRRADGYNGWSTRGQFLLYLEDGNPLAGRTPIGNYAYYADMPDYYGSSWVWSGGGLGMLEVDQWYSLEQFVKLNDPGQSNGILRAWVDGRLAFEKTDIMYRRDPALKIESVWMNVYHGGTPVAPRDLVLYIDNVVIADAYIGPMRR